MANWFEFKGTRSTALGVYVTDYPPHTVPEERVEFVEVPGRSGSLTVTEGDGVYDDITLAIECYARDTARVNEIAAWLRGAGKLVLGNAPGYAYRARAVNQIELEKIVRGRDNRTFKAVFRCAPHRYEANPVVRTLINGDLVANPGNAHAEPIITVYGTGDVALLIGASTVLISNLSGSIVLDCEAMIAYQPGTPALLKTDSVTLLGSGWPRIPVGGTAIQWSGSVSKVEIQPQWRWL